MATRTCPSCGATNTADDSFCAKCGSKLTVTPAETGGRSTSREVHYATVTLPAWLTLGMVFVLLGGLLILIGFMIFVVGTASLGSTTTLDSLKTYLEEFAALAGVGFFLAPIGWALHQMSVHRRRG
jgi:uncharacterized membrane protein YvbJ